MVLDIQAIYGNENSYVTLVGLVRGDAAEIYNCMVVKAKVNKFEIKT